MARTREAEVDAVQPETSSESGGLGSFLLNLLIWAVLILALVSMLAGGYRLLFVKAVDNYETAFKYNWWTGNITKVTHPGWMTVVPGIIVGHTIDGRPRQVCLNANARVLNCKLVRFNPAGLDEFIAMHGRTAGDDPENLYEILRSYAFDGTADGTWKFLTIDRRLEIGGVNTGGVTETKGPPQ